MVARCAPWFLPSCCFRRWGPRLVFSSGPPTGPTAVLRTPRQGGTVMPRSRDRAARTASRYRGSRCARASRSAQAWPSITTCIGLWFSNPRKRGRARLHLQRLLCPIGAALVRAGQISGNPVGVAACTQLSDGRCARIAPRLQWMGARATRAVYRAAPKTRSASGSAAASVVPRLAARCAAREAMNEKRPTRDTRN
jgi:hypothetical protein